LAIGKGCVGLPDGDGDFTFHWMSLSSERTIDTPVRCVLSRPNCRS
jgi:hypothetical protein